MPAAPSQDEIRRYNLGALLRHVHLRGAMSRAELTADLGLNRSTIGALTADLAGAGLVREEPPGKGLGRAGRPSLVVRPESERVCVLAFTVEPDRITAARVGIGGIVLDRREANREYGNVAPKELVSPLAELATQMRRAARETIFVGAGAAVSTIVRGADGAARAADDVGWLDEPFGEALGEALADVLGPDRPLTIRNDADARALAEHTRGVAVGCDNLIYLHGDAAVGGGIIAAGRPVTGHGGHGGEVGHMVVNPHGKPCRCGSRGCWETEIGERALLHAAGRKGYGPEAVFAVIDAAARRDTVAQAAVREVGDWLGFGVANLVNIFNPEMVVFGGMLREVYLAAAAQVRSRLNHNGLPACREHLRLRTPSLGDDAALLGAAELAFEGLLTDPLELGSHSW